MIPEKDDLFIPFGEYSQCLKILKSGYFFPTLLTGPSGIGKTMFIEQSCAELGKEFFRINITFQTDEDDLIGGLRLIDGSTVFEKGPAILAMERGAVLLYDEVDLANPLLIMSQQSIMEGKGYFIKKTGEWIKPKDGFQIFATANTKGIGDDTGQFVGTQVLNEAFLERFPITLECSFPPANVEKKILTRLANKLNIQNEKFIDALITFANKVREEYNKGIVENTISTRRLVHILRTLAIFGNPVKSVRMCLSRFDEGTAKGFMDHFNLEYAQVGEDGDGEDMNFEPWTAY